MSKFCCPVGRLWSNLIVVVGSKKYSLVKIYFFFWWDRLCLELMAISRNFLVLLFFLQDELLKSV